jgi:DNA-binding CsgD family transcriptional regulator
MSAHEGRVDAEAVLSALAVVGQDVDLALAEAVAGLPREELLDVLETGRREGLLTVDSAGIRFAAAGRGRLLEAQAVRARAEAHAHAAAILERLRPQDPVAIAIQRAGAVAILGIEPVLAGIESAAAAALRIYDWETAAALLGRAAELARAEQDLRAGRLELRRARALYAAGLYADAMDACRRAARAGRLLGDLDMLAESALVIRGIDGREMCAEMLDMVRAALPVVAQGSALQARLLAQEAMLVASLERQAANPAKTAEALRLAEACGDPRALIEALHASQMSHSGPAGAGRRLAIAEQVEGLAIAAGMHEYLRWPLGWRVDGLWLQGSRPALDEAIGRLEELGKARNDGLALWKALVARAALLQAEGRFEPALRLAADARALAERGGHDMASFIYRIFRSEHDVLTGDTDGEDHRIRDFPLGGELIAIYPAMEAAVRGDLETARIFLEVAWPHRQKASGHDLELSIRWAFALTIGALERVDLAAEVRADLAPYADMMAVGANGQAAWSGPVALSMARMSALLGDPARSEEDFARALRRSIEFNDRVALTYTRFEWAVTLIRRGMARDRDRAASLLEAAQRDAASLGMRPLLGRIESLQSSQRAGPSHPLSARELEVARLVAAGLSNKEVAAQLRLSVRTAENHLLNVMNKLGMANRAQVAAWMARLDEGASSTP